MPFVSRNGVRLYWRFQGAGKKPVLVLLNSIGTDMSLWDAAVPHLLPAFSLLRLDARGHGASDAPNGDYSLDLLAADVVAVMDAAGVDNAAIAGVSLGGMIAMELALRHPERVTMLALVCTSATTDRVVWDDRAASVRANGIATIGDLTMGRFLSPAFARNHPATTETVRRSLLATTDVGYAGAATAIRDMTLGERVSAITQPTLVVVGDRDVSMPFTGHGDFLAARIPIVRLEHVDAAHLAPVEAPVALAAALRRFLLPKREVEAAAEVLFEAGLSNRRRVLGDEWVDRALAQSTPFNAEFQDMITRVAWHEIWGRPGLDDRTRRLIVLAVTGSLGRLEEFALHVRAGLARGGFTAEELKETLMQIAIYAGVPAANTAFAESSRILAELNDAHMEDKP